MSKFRIRKYYVESSLFHRLKQIISIKNVCFRNYYLLSHMPLSYIFLLWNLSLCFALFHMSHLNYLNGEHKDLGVENEILRISKSCMFLWFIMFTKTSVSTKEHCTYYSTTWVYIHLSLIQHFHLVSLRIAAHKTKLYNIMFLLLITN